MKKLALLLALVGLAASALSAQSPVTGPYLIDHYSNILGSGVTYHFAAEALSFAGIGATEFLFTEPQFLTADTTIPASAIVVVTQPSPCTIVDVKLLNPGAAFFAVVVDLSAGCPAFAQYFFNTGPATSNGVYTFSGATSQALTLTTAPDTQVRLVNFGATGSPLTSPTGDVCANIYVFDANQEMAACCSCRITPNGVKTLSVSGNLTSKPVTSIIPVNGDIKIVSTAASTSTCTPLSFNGGLTDSLVGFGTHVSTTGTGSFITETQIPAAALSSQEQSFLPQACQLARYLGSGKGTCSCIGNTE